MSDGVDRIQGFAVGMREEALSGDLSAKGSKILEAVLDEIVPKATTASAQGVQSMLVRLDVNIESLRNSGDLTDPAAGRLHALTRGLNPPNAKSYPGGGILSGLTGGSGKLVWIAAVAGAAALAWFFFRKKRR